MEQNTLSMEQKIKRILDAVKSRCDMQTYIEMHLIANDGHYDETSGAYALSTLHYRNGSPEDAGVELDSLYEISKAKMQELGLDFYFTKWDAMVYTAMSFSIHWSTVGGDLETAVTIAIENMAYTFV